HLVAHAVEDHAVGHGLVELGAAELDELGLHAPAHGVHLGDEGLGEGVLAAAQDADAHGAPRWGRAGMLERGADSSKRPAGAPRSGVDAPAGVLLAVSGRL